MAAQNDYQTFGDSGVDGVNKLSLVNYTSDQDRVYGNGYTTKVIRSQLHNKVLQQVSKLSAALAQFLANNNIAALDTDSMSTLATKIGTASGQVYDSSNAILSSNSSKYINHFTGTSTGALSIKITGLVTATATTVDLGYMEILITQDDRDHTSSTNPPTYKLLIKGNMDAGVWYNTQAVLIGTSQNTSINVRFTRTSTDAYIEIGETTATWYYATIEVFHVVSYVISGYSPSFLATIQASFLGATATDSIISATGNPSTVLNNRNRIINGAMNINQINGTGAVTPSTSGYIADQQSINISQASKLTFQTVLDAPAGFKYSSKYTVAAQYAPTATDFFQVRFPIAGQDIIDFQLGTAGAVTIITSLYVKSSIAGTYSISLRNGALNRAYVGTITVTTGWTRVSINLVGDTTGTWAIDNTAGISCAIDLGSGSNYNTTAGTWQAGGFSRTAGSVTFVNQVVGSTFNITGVQLEKAPIGTTQPTDYEFLKYPIELFNCMSYYEITQINMSAYSSASSAFNYSIPWKVEKISNPVVTQASGTSVNITSISYVGTNQNSLIALATSAGANGTTSFAYNIIGSSFL